MSVAMYESLSMRAAALILIALLWPAQAWATCTQSDRAVGAFLTSLPNDCTKDSDCEVAYLSANSCAPAFVMAKSWKKSENRKQLLHLQTLARRDCAEEWSKQPACSPAPSKAICENKYCIDAMKPHDSTKRKQ